jgi:uncharacterized repeat protein (TIGR03803 family)
MVKLMKTGIKYSFIVSVLAATLGLMMAVPVTAQTLTTLYSFTQFTPISNTDGAAPKAGLILSENRLYGTAFAGGSSLNGTVFAVNTDGTGFTNLHTFTTTSSPSYTNSDRS